MEAVLKDTGDVTVFFMESGVFSALSISSLPEMPMRLGTDNNLISVVLEVKE